MWLGLLIMFGGLALAALIITGAVAFERFHAEMTHANIIGKEAHIVQWHGDKGTVYIRNRKWPAYSADPFALPSGARVLVSRIDNGALKIQPIEQDIESAHSA